MMAVPQSSGIAISTTLSSTTTLVLGSLRRGRTQGNLRPSTKLVGVKGQFSTNRLIRPAATKPTSRRSMLPPRVSARFHIRLALLSTQPSAAVVFRPASNNAAVLGPTPAPTATHQSGLPPAPKGTSIAVKRAKVLES